MRPLALAAVAVCAIASICILKDTGSGNLWPRTVEPRLSVPTAWSPCCAAPERPPALCDPLVRDVTGALRMLVTNPRCTDPAIDALKRLNDPADAAAAYYVRAKRENQPLDLLWALDDNPVPFNRALTLEALGLNDAALAAWNEACATERGSWLYEARQHRDRLANSKPRGPTLAEQLQALEETPDLPADARQRAAAIAQRTHDPYAVDVVEWMGRASPQQREGVLTFAAARQAYRAFHRVEATSEYENAARQLKNGPLALVARFEVVRSQLIVDPQRSLHLLEPLAGEADHYPYLLARIEAARGYCYFWSSRYVESLTAYDRARTLYDRVGDLDGVAITHANEAGDYRTAGNLADAWREAVLAMRGYADVGNPQSRHVILGETAKAALELDRPQIALLFQNRAVAVVEHEFGALPPAQRDRNLAVALRERAAMELRLSQRDAATQDLAKAEHLAVEPGDVAIQRSLQARLGEVEGDALLTTDPSRAAAAFTQAFLLTADTKAFHTFRTSLLAKRAVALHRAGDSAGAERDLRAALTELGQEEAALLKGRAAGEGDDLWSRYFDRFRASYELLVQLLLDQKRTGEAFAYAERERAFEPLDLALQRPDVPQEFRTVIANSTDVAQLQPFVPPGTVIVEYLVLGDRTYAWLLSHDRFDVLRLRAKRSDVERWTGAVQHAVRGRDNDALGFALVPPYGGLLADPLDAIRKSYKGASRLVFVPDQAIHGLPLAALKSSTFQGRYLIQDYTVAVAPSAKLYLLSVLEDARMKRDRSIVLFGDPAFDRTLPDAQDLTPLNGAKDEVDAIAALYGPGVTPHTGAAATGPAFLSLVPNYALVHIAAHAVIKPSAPSQSFLLLAPSAHDRGALDAHRILTDLKLHETRLVLLSACSSAGGLPVGPEGVTPLVRPLLAKGVPAVIGSLWDVRDATARELMVSFHRRYRQGSDAASAMQQAQLELLGNNKNPGLRSAFAWAPFQVIGQASSPFAASH